MVEPVITSVVAPSSSVVEPVETPNLTKQFGRLKQTLLKNSFRRSVWFTISFIIGLLYALGMVVLAIIGAVLGGGAAPELTGQIMTIVGAIAILAWLIVPLVAFGIDATVDPHRFTLYPIPLKRLMVGIGVAGALGVPGMATALALLGTSFAWWRHPAALVPAVIGAIGAFALCIIGSRALTTWLAPKLERRRTREIITVLLIIPLLLMSPIIQFLAERFSATAAEVGGVSGIFDNVTRIIGWTPFGAPWGMAVAAYHNDWLGVIIRLLILAATIAGAWLLWEHSLKRALESPQEQPTSTANVKGIGFLGRANTPAGAVAARTATYWLRDPRYSMALLIYPLMPLLIMIPAVMAPPEEYAVRYLALIIGPLTGWVIGFGMSNDIGYDYTAFSLHVATGLSGRDDRWGRIIPSLLLGLFFTITFSIISVWFIGQWSWLPPVLGLSVGILLVALAVSAVTSAKFVYPVAKPGESPFKQPQGAAAATMIAQGASMGLSIGLGLPLLALALWAIIGNLPWLGWLVLLIGPLLGALALRVGIRIGAKLLDKGAPELLQKVTNFM